MEEFANFNVPRFKGFEDDESTETFFDVDLDQVDGNQETNSENSDNYQSFSVTETANGPIYSLRKSISSSNIVLEQEMERNCALNFKVTSRCDAHLEFLKKRNVAKYCSTAEQVANFWIKPESRFSSKPIAISYTKSKYTIPQSPHLLSQGRCRSTTIMSREDLEFKEFLEAQKDHPKAQPLNKKIFLTPKVPEVPVKQTTVVKPFKLTQVKPKQNEAPQEVFKFQACPIPKSVFSAPKLPVPFKPKRMTKKVQQKKIPPKPQPVVEKRTKVEPFSFDEKIKKMQHQKELKIQKVIQEEKIAREFKATPIMPVVLNNFCKSASSSVKSSKSEDALNGLLLTKSFKATDPKVLYKEPFIPKRANKKTVPINPQLNTITRAQERAEFERRRKEKEEMEEKYRQKRAQEEKEREQLEIQRLRKKAEFKATPISYFKELQIHCDGKVTIPQSPIVKQRSNKENHF
ncbi:targeting protein for Xklp2 homolog [Onthophagus taurus]|uniref:targeting protein for Xklp2 homolog n=1 Tax=Onthophagus taurus TaxID=166361 RepID=UPI0039BDD6A9